ncbi:MAG: tRNA guanosine(34) transglycosylase Tgt [Candidatus Nanoperiomorbaceae bacterium]
MLTGQSTFHFDPIRPTSAELTRRFPLMRAGVIHTPHGDIKTPTFTAVGTHGAVIFVTPEVLRKVDAQVMLSNGYHLFHQAVLIDSSGGLAEYNGWHGPTMTDSGGFQVMSLGSGLGKVISMQKLDVQKSERLTDDADRLAAVDDDGVTFRDPHNGRVIKFTPEISLQTQHKIGADIMMSFDELTNITDSYEYNVTSLERTRRWAERGLREHLRQTNLRAPKPYQALYGCLQGSSFRDLRQKAATDLAAMRVDGFGFDGFGLGGALVKENLGEMCRWMNEILPDNKPRHLLGLSHPDDIFAGVEQGCDTFDCVAPTREARHGRIYTVNGNISLQRGRFADDRRILDPGCDCPTCRAGISRRELRALLKSSERADHAQYFALASAHNLRFIVRLTEEIRNNIIDGDYSVFKDNFMKQYYS